MFYVQAIAPDGIAQSTVEISDDVWAKFSDLIRSQNPGYRFDVLDYVPDPGGLSAPDRHCENLAAALEWARSLDPEED